MLPISPKVYEEQEKYLCATREGCIVVLENTPAYVCHAYLEFYNASAGYIFYWYGSHTEIVFEVYRGSSLIFKDTCDFMFNINNIVFNLFTIFLYNYTILKDEIDSMDNDIVDRKKNLDLRVWTRKPQDREYGFRGNLLQFREIEKDLDVLNEWYDLLDTIQNTPTSTFRKLGV